jgi:hypothetical protein
VSESPAKPQGGFSIVDRDLSDGGVEIQQLLLANSPRSFTHLAPSQNKTSYKSIYYTIEKFMARIIFQGSGVIVTPVPFEATENSL